MTMGRTTKTSGGLESDEGFDSESDPIEGDLTG